ncbi:hypothetical protein [Sulfolobus sp. E11-6]|uniref:hypothetical protein n=1 Tax=Sulfolobus sp. E11-6 TaxID=2663020 RepID=UPI00129794A2|nr:hypothetical protein [Sulfolobus sp. E11-6]QGA69236.1 hypothetical protein GFS33_11515 [Sulfolobus sp. E11-6]
MALLAIVSLIFSIIYKIRENAVNALWYIGYIITLLIMTYIGSDGALNIINFYYSSAIVVIVAIIFYFIGVYSRIRYNRS